MSRLLQKKQASTVSETFISLETYLSGFKLLPVGRPLLYPVVHLAKDTVYLVLQLACLAHGASLAYASYDNRGQEYF